MIVHSLEHVVELAKTLDGESVALQIADWSAIVTLFDAEALWDADRLDAWIRAQTDVHARYVERVQIRYASPAAFVLAGLGPEHDLDAYAEAFARASETFVGSAARSLEAFRSQRAAPPSFSSRYGRAIWLRRPTREQPWALTLVARLDDAAAEQELLRSEARYRAIVEDQTDFIVRYTPDGIRTFVNDAYARFFGGKPEDFVGQSFFSLIAEEHRAAVLDKLHTLIARAPESIADEHLSIRHDGVPCWTHWVDRGIVDEHGAVIEVQAVGRDITERKEAEQRMAQAQKMQALGALAGGLAHDFNNTLTGVLGLADLIALDPTDVELVREYAENIRQATERASELTRSLLQLSRTPPKRLGACELGELLESAARLLRATTPRRIEVEVEVEDLPRVEADAGQLTQALLNLGINARDAIADRGTITLFARAGEEDGGRIVIVGVRDDGSGIPEHVRERLFEPFFTTKPEGKGTGLGLAMVYACASAHGGRIELDTELGRGTSFELRLPLVEAGVARTPRRSNGETILLVDDDPLIVLHSRGILERSGYTVLTASGKDDAIRRYSGQFDEIDAVVTDLVMPDGGGRELERALHARRPELPILLVTGGLAEHGSGRGRFTALLEKPFSADDLLQRVAEMLR